MDDLALAREALAEGHVAAARWLAERRLGHAPGDPEAIELLGAIRDVEKAHDVPDDATPPPAIMPLGVAILGGLVIVSGAIVLILGFIWMGGSPGAGFLLVLLGAAQITAGVGLLRLRFWAWGVTMIVSALGLIFDLLSLENNPRAVFLLALRFIILVYLVAVVRHFRPAAARRPPTQTYE